MAIKILSQFSLSKAIFFLFLPSLNEIKVSWLNSCRAKLIPKHFVRDLLREFGDRDSGFVQGANYPVYHNAV